MTDPQIVPWIAFRLHTHRGRAAIDQVVPAGGNTNSVIVPAVLLGPLGLGSRFNQVQGA